MAAYDGRGSGSGGDFLNTGLHTTDYMDGRGVDPGDFGFGKHPMLVLGLLVAADITFAVIASPFTLASKLKSVAKSRKSRRKMNKKAEIFKLNHNQGLCDRCREITIAKLRQGIEHSPDYSSLLENSHKCPLCRLIASSLPPPPQVASNTKISVTLYDMDRVEIGIRGASPLRIWSLPDSAAISVAPPRLLRPSNSIPADFNLALSWLQRCLKTHLRCQPNSSAVNSVSYKQPHRLIDVSMSHSPRLVEPLQETNASWVALSHCWGTVPLLRTMTDNIDSFKTIIPWAQLPRTFQDAMVTTRALGFQYIWIDSLCIIQDSPSDWSTESALMPGIYSNAAVTIEADSTPSSLHGLFTPQEYIDQGVRLDIDVDDNKGEIYFGRKTEQVKDPSFLAARAWCLQERVLSRRILTFQEHHMSWTCALESHNDEVVLPKPESLLGAKNYSSFLHTLQSVLDASPKDRKAATLAANNAWYRLLSGYTRRSLTNPGDKLVAMSGIAEAMASATKDHYLAGLWRDSLPGGLLWIPEDSQPKDTSKIAPISEKAATLPETYRAPSWSWASLDGAIDFPSPTTGFTTGTEFPISPICTVLDAQTEPVSPAAVFGQVNGGFIQLVAPFKEVKLGRFSVAGGGNYEWVTRLHYDISEPEVPVYAIHVLFDRGLLIVETAKKDVFRRVGVLIVVEDDEEYGTPNVFDGCEKREIILV